jgi:nucleoside-diphosphate-sugar epimerase
MRIAVFGASGPTGQLVCLQALAADMQVRAVTRRPGAFPLGYPRLEACRAEVTGSDDAQAGTVSLSPYHVTDPAGCRVGTLKRLNTFVTAIMSSSVASPASS